VLLVLVLPEELQVLLAAACMLQLLALLPHSC
jgi:hypothetical protein